MRDSAIVNYHVRSEEPQTFHFDVDGVFGKLLSPELRPTRVTVQDLRSERTSVDFDTDGITFERHVSRIKDFEGRSDWQQGYDNELRALLVERIGAEEVIVFDHTVRVDDPDAERKPARNVHNDYSASGAQQRLIDILGEDTCQGISGGAL